MASHTNVGDKFRAAFEQRCFRLIIEAYKTSLTKKVIQLDWNENDISSELHEYIEVNPLRKKYKITTNVEQKLPKDAPKVKGFADRFPRIDFRFVTFLGSEDYKYFFEAKNLKHKDNKLTRRYINTGIDNFTSKKYENGSVIGYLLEGKIDETVTGINALLSKDRRDGEILCLKSNILFEFYYESNHPDVEVLKHLIFDFTVMFQ